ncbi:MAG TPA: YkvA family protein [Pyrinomonadaceae bacterium]|nr:YkvA family protein [Pyrinomonadaceae bacterium]
MSALLAKRRLKNVLLFIPNMVLLCARLLADSRVPTTERALVAGAIIYALVPLDLIPDMLPFVGQIDDAYLIALSLLRLMERTDPKVVREHWKGGGDIVELIGSAAMVAAKFLPKPIRRVLTARVENADGSNMSLKGLRKPLLIAQPEPEQISDHEPQLKAPVNEARP